MRRIISLLVLVSLFGCFFVGTTNASTIYVKPKVGYFRNTVARIGVKFQVSKKVIYRKTRYSVLSIQANFTRNVNTPTLLKVRSILQHWNGSRWVKDWASRHWISKGRVRKLNWFNTTRRGNTPYMVMLFSKGNKIRVINEFECPEWTRGKGYVVQYYTCR
ncbi:MAG: hypothetical protein C4562_02675 [Actinobacteria bacterium]|nr:MAG: hypothetical protein C4562_02675 [Actinomycetota bacterium]